MYSITLQNPSDIIIESGDKLGYLNFSAPNEFDGGAGKAIVGTICAQAEGAFSAISSPASLIFGTANNNASGVVSRLKITESGHFWPMASGTYDIGSSSFPFRDIYARNVPVLISTITAANSATVDFTSGINGAYKRYKIEIDGLLPATDISILMIRVSLDGGSTWKSGASDYAWVGTRNYSSSSATTGSTATSEIRIGGPGTGSNNFMSNVATETASLRVNIGDPSSGNRVPIWGDGAWFAEEAGVGISHCVFGGLYLTAGAVNGIRFLMSAGNITQGTFRLYGSN